MSKGEAWISIRCPRASRSQVSRLDESALARMYQEGWRRSPRPSEPRILGVMRIPSTPSARAARTARWATTMTRWAIRFSSGGKRSGTRASKRWQFVTFPGPAGAESRGIVDLVAIRRDHRPRIGVFEPGDLFEIVLVQIKGGAAAWPSLSALARLKAVGRRYGAQVVLAAWKKGAEPTFHRLKSVSTERSKAWVEVEAVDVFGEARRAPPTAVGRTRGAR